MLKRLNGFKKFYLFSLVFLVIELLLVVFGLSFIPILCSLWFDSLFFVLFCHIWTNFYKKSGAESVHAFSFIFSFIFSFRIHCQPQILICLHRIIFCFWNPDTYDMIFLHFAHLLSYFYFNPAKLHDGGIKNGCL